MYFTQRNHAKIQTKTHKKCFTQKITFRKTKCPFKRGSAFEWKYTDGGAIKCEFGCSRYATSKFKTLFSATTNHMVEISE